MWIATMVSVSIFVNGLLSHFDVIDKLEGRALTDFWLASGALYTVILLLVMVLRKRRQLTRTDQYVAAEVHARRVIDGTKDLKERQLVNIVEEMSVASGIAAPTVYIWDAGDAVNALTIGQSESDAAMFISRRATDVLTRDELQALVGYGMSQILNGDMALNVKLASYVYAFRFAPRVTNFFLFFPRGQKGMKFVQGIFAWLLLYLWLGLLLALVTYPQWFATRLLQMGVGRERQKLADASALQFTRNPEAVQGLYLKAIAFGTVATDRPKLLEDLAHACFAEPARKNRWLLPHQSLERRLLTHDPRFNLARIPQLRVEFLEQARKREESAGGAVFGIQRSDRVEKQHRFLARVGGFVPAVATVAEVAAASAAVTPLRAADDPRAALIALLLDVDRDIRHRQLVAVRTQFGDDSMIALAQAVRELQPLTPAERTVALDTHLPLLRRLPRAELQRLAATLRALEAADASADLFKYAITRRALVFLRDLLEPRALHGRQPLSDFANELQLVFSLVAAQSAAGTQRQAYEKGMSRLGMQFDRAYQPLVKWGSALDAALDRLEKLKPVAKDLLLEGLQATMQFDQHEAQQERELLRMVANSLHCPLPREPALEMASSRRA